MSVLLLVLLANLITFVFFFACHLSPLVSLLSPESDVLSDVSFSTPLSSFGLVFTFYATMSCIYVGNRIEYTYLGNLCLNLDVHQGFLWLQSMCDKKFVVVISLELHL